MNLGGQVKPKSAATKVAADKNLSGFQTTFFLNLINLFENDSKNLQVIT
jgi:hypothetical protein